MERLHVVDEGCQINETKPILDSSVNPIKPTHTYWNIYAFIGLSGLLFIHTSLFNFNITCVNIQYT